MESRTVIPIGQNGWMINCGHCGGAHGSVREVRECSSGGTPVSHERPPEHDTPNLADPGPFSDPEPSLFGAPPSTQRHTSAAPSAIPSALLAPLVVDPADLAGPDQLGRSLLVVDSGPIPQPWADCLRMQIDPARVDNDMLAELRRIHADRERRVFILTGPLAHQPDHTIQEPAWQLDADFHLGAERLVWLLTANAVDARDPGAVHFRPVQLALAAGATLGGMADVQLADGSSRWCDGGPLDTAHIGVEPPVMPVTNLEVGSTSSIGSAAVAADLAPDQLAAVAHPGGGARIIAPAGSGKTRVLTERARHLITNLGIDPRAICLVAFNVRARREMEERTPDLPGLEVRTLNSLGMAIINGTGRFAMPAGRRSRDVIDERQVRDLLRPMIKVPRAAMQDPMAAWVDALGACRLGLRDPREVEDDFGGDVTDFARVLPQYRDQLARRGVMDFDEQIIGAIEVLLTDPHARRVARTNCQLLLVDEFQDLTPAHMLLLRLLAGPSSSIFGVGDDDQTIYGFSGATPEWLIRYDHFVPEAGAHPLTVNYRCPPTVVTAAQTLLTHNRRRVDKAITAAPQRNAADGELQVVTTDEPTMATLARVRQLIEAGTRASDIAILTRVNTSLLAPMLALDQAQLPTAHPVNRRLLDRTGVSAALAWLRIATTGGSLMPDDIEMTARRPPRGLSRVLIGWMTEQRNVRDLRGLASRLNKDRDTERVLAYADDIEQLRSRASGATTRELLVAIRDDLSLGAALDGLDSSKRSVDRSTHGDDIAALIAAAGLEPDPLAFEPWLRARLDKPGDPDGIRLSTIHRVKGLEWPHVIVHEATMGLMPHRLSADRAEERRIFHVAITRAQESLTVVAGSPASPYVLQMETAWDPKTAVPDEPAVRPQAKAGTRSGGRSSGSSAAPRRGEDRSKGPSELDVASRKVANRIRAWRLERSKEDKVPAYVVFKDATLEEIAIKKPTSLAELGRISGIGPTKLERYGDEIIAIVDQ